MTTNIENYADDLEKSNDRAGKTYEFDLKSDPSKVHEYFFQESEEGLILFVIFYTLACRWNLCTGCNLPSVSSSRHIGYRDLMKQVDGLFADPEIKKRLPEIKKCIFSNNGSMLDEETFSSTALVYLLALCNMHLPELRTVTLETRIEYVDLEELEFLSRVLKEGDQHPDLELAIGFEAFDDEIRNKHFLKGMTLNRFEEFVEKVAPYKFHLKSYFMQKPVTEISDEEAYEDICKAIDYLSSIADKYQVEMNMHLNPTYAARGTKLAADFVAGKYTPPTLRDTARAVLHSEGKSITVFVGLSDEGLAINGGSFLSHDEPEYLKALENYNETGNYTDLKKLLSN